MVRKYVNGAWQDIESPKIYEGGGMEGTGIHEAVRERDVGAGMGECKAFVVHRVAGSRYNHT